MSKHTPGPWRAVMDDFNHDGGIIGYIEDARGYVIADVTFDDVNGIDAPSFEECYANGRIMEAAPEMYEALRLLDHYIRTFGSPDHLLDEEERKIAAATRAALAKAEGSQP